MKQTLIALALVVFTAPLWAQVGKSVGWTNPTAYEDGTPLSPTDIRETRLSFATVSSASTPTIVEIVPGAATTYSTLPVFGTGTWFVRAQTVDQLGATSDYSNEATFTVGRCEANPASCRPRPPTLLTAL